MLERHRSPVSALGSSSKHEALGRTAVLFYLPDQEGEDRQSPRLLRYADPDGTTRSGSCRGDRRQSDRSSPLLLLHEEPGGEFLPRAFLEQTDGWGGTPFSGAEDPSLDGKGVPVTCTVSCVLLD